MKKEETVMAVRSKPKGLKYQANELRINLISNEDALKGLLLLNQFIRTAH